MGKIEAGNIHAGIHHFDQKIYVALLRSHCAYDFRFLHKTVLPSHEIIAFLNSILR